MSDQATEPAPARRSAVVLEDSEEDHARMQELEQRIEAQGGIEPRGPGRGHAGRASARPQTMVAEARKHLGYRETGENDTKFNRWLGAIKGYPHDGFGYPWCHAFVSYCLWHRTTPAQDRGRRAADGRGLVQAAGSLLPEPRVGYLVYYGPNGGTHVELVVGVSGGSIQTIGGNTSGSLDGKTFFNGDGVYQKTVQRTSRIFGYGHPEFSSGAAPAGGGGGAPAQANGAGQADHVDPLDPPAAGGCQRPRAQAAARRRWRVGTEDRGGREVAAEEGRRGRRRRVGERDRAALRGFLEVTDVRGRLPRRPRKCPRSADRQAVAKRVELPFRLAPGADPTASRTARSRCGNTFPSLVAGQRVSRAARVVGIG